nr:transposase [Nitrobacter hamburgensis]
MLLAVWYDLSDVKLAGALDDRASFRRFCGWRRCRYGACGTNRRHARQRQR